jgi:hypothetical protein
MSNLRRTTLALIAADQQGKHFDPELIHSLMDWLEERHAAIQTTDHPLHACLLEGLETYYQSLEHLVQHQHREALLLVYQAEDLFSDVERQVACRAWAA